MRQLIPVAAITLSLAGCLNLKPESWGGGSCGHSSDRKDGRVDYDITHLTRNNETYLVLLTHGVRAGSCRTGPPASGTLRTDGGWDVEWTCDTPDGRKGRITIGTERYALENGAVFLISLRDGKAAVEQVAVPLDQLQGGVPEERLRAAARTNDRLGEFFKVIGTPVRTE